MPRTAPGIATEPVGGDPDEFRLDRDPGLNLLYGAGVHVCPGAPLARLELLAIMQALLERTEWLALDAQRPPVHAYYPGSGFASLHVNVRKTGAAGESGANRH